MEQNKIEARIALLAAFIAVILSICSMIVVLGAAIDGPDEAVSPTEATETEITEYIGNHTEETQTAPTEETEPPTVPAETTPEEYLAAKILWDRLQQAGYSEPVCAGIIGNCMAEVGGGTLRLHWDAYGDRGYFYGICQWSSCYFPEVQGKDLLFQIQYLIDTMPRQFGSGLESFLAIEDPAAAAIRFAKSYERCASWAVGVRAGYARTAYEYFRAKNE